MKQVPGTYHGRRSGPPGDDAEYWMPRDMFAWERSWERWIDENVGPGLNIDGTPGRIPAGAPLNTSDRKSGPVDMSPEAVAARAEFSRQHAEAIAYVAGYTGRWGLPLDIRANPRWGTKHLKLSERQVEVLLAGKARDQERAEQAAAARPEGYDEVLRLLAEARPGEFINSLREQVARGRTLSEKQIAAILRGANRGLETTQAAGVAPQRPPGSPMAGDIPEGWYMVGDQPWKVQWNRAHTGKYGLRLVDPHGGDRLNWEFVSGGLRIVATGRPMTLDEASAFGKLYGICVICGAKLTDPESIARGIGPICAGKL